MRRFLVCLVCVWAVTTTLAQVRPPYMPPPRPPKGSTPKVKPKSEEVTPETVSAAEKEIQVFLDEWRDTLIKRDPEAMGKFYLQTAEFVGFDPGSAFEITGWANYRKSFSDFFARFSAISHCTFEDAHVSIEGETAAWFRAVGKIDALGRDGKPVLADQVRWRQTSILEKRGGRWLIIHEHRSAPAGNQS